MSDIEGENVVMRDEQSILINGENSLVINDNTIAYTEAKRQQLITAIFNAVKGFEYKAFELTGQWVPYLETLDNVQIKDKAGNTYNSFLFRYYGKSPNGLDSEMSAPSITDATVEYQNVASAEQVARRTELKVDKQEQTITGIIERNDEFENQLTQVEQDIDSINQSVQDIVDYKRDLCGTTEIHLEDAGAQEILSLEVAGNKTYPTNLYLGENVYPSADLQPNQEVI